MNDINSSFGKGGVTKLGSAGGSFVNFTYAIHTDCYFVYPVYGPESSGKTTLALHAIVEVHVSFFLTKLGGNAMLVDAEHAFDPAYSKALGVDIENLIVCQPDNGEMALETTVSRRVAPAATDVFSWIRLVTASSNGGSTDSKLMMPPKEVGTIGKRRGLSSSRVRSYGGSQRTLCFYLGKLEVALARSITGTLLDIAPWRGGRGFHGWEEWRLAQILLIPGSPRYRRLDQTPPS
uniref:RecA-like N-terminal domain-containing protein n=1 Tax=Oryza glumipatula TaxID=40148 RepID=A0A0D9ZAW5_9ORYZ